MKFEELDKKMRAFELSMDQIIAPELYIIVRLDGRSFTKLTKETFPFERPFDIQFRDAMIQTVQHLMNCGFKMAYGYTESDEISLLFDKEEDGFGRKARKLISVLAGEASAKFSLTMNTIGVFDCRIVPLPTKDLVIDYFRWRAEDAHRNAVNAYCYWKLRDSGIGASTATEKLRGMPFANKKELLLMQGVDYSTVPAWQKRGIGFYYQMIQKKSFNPIKEDYVLTDRKVLRTDLELAIDLKYTEMLNEIIE